MNVAALPLDMIRCGALRLMTMRRLTRVRRTMMKSMMMRLKRLWTRGRELITTKTSLSIIKKLRSLRAASSDMHSSVARALMASQLTRTR